MNEHKETLAPRETTIEGAREVANQRSEELSRGQEKNPEHTDSEAVISRERHRIESLFSAENSAGEHKKAHLDGDHQAASKKMPIPASTDEREKSYQQTMTHIRQEMSTSEKAFSKFIHRPTVERTSEIIGSTVARPNALLAGSFTAFIAVTGVYIVAKNMGYALSGFETIGAFLIGWAIGLIYDYTRIALGKK